MNQISCGPYTLDYSQKTIIMGILNVTPDSFSDGGRFYAIDQALYHARDMIRDGADIIDIGGESTRPGYERITDEEELERVIPVVEALSSEFDVPLSIDTYKAKVARGAIKAGAHIINDIWGGKADPDMAAAAAESGAPIILMHNRHNRDYAHFIRDAINDLYESIHIMKKAGVTDDKIILDPGIGFAKDFHLNLKMMSELDKIVMLGYPVLLGTSRKGFIGQVLDLPAQERMEGTGATVCYGIQKGCQLIRIHDVKEMARMARMMDALMQKGEQNG
ncbi:dihydropteroate synthase [Peribacillus kribbensis]|uniref:dihydropteroate synthase n=1 Tax=Peribacillus kribbensis TaxID=356658 RepID=UPI00040809DE|nr:dihydropteroate synthase [Peribacillus kribbensis]